MPAGVNNPQGFGGVPGPGGLLQVGGGQNTLNNSFGPYPVGAVTTGVADTTWRMAWSSRCRFANRPSKSLIVRRIFSRFSRTSFPVS